MDNILSWWVIYSLALCFILSYILIYFCRPLYTLLYILLYTTQPRIFYTTLTYSIIYSLLYTYYYIFLYILSTLLYYLLFSNNIINLAPPFYTPLLYLLSLSYILATFIFLYSHIVIPTLLYRKGYNYAAADFYTLYITILIYIAILIFTAALISTVVLLYHF